MFLRRCDSTIRLVAVRERRVCFLEQWCWLLPTDLLEDTFEEINITYGANVRSKVLELLYTFAEQAKVVQTG